ncbi:MAG: sigma 54 modulation/S30EA ribosomal C-terminal domain-containing protein, partial [Bryobacterales bacterium]|nr:sigma 54 modulation/S30EA ribosomal C-terminal domain-containing protein [Bryobacterales bacterium]
RNARVILTAQRHLQRAEITVKYYDHDLVGLSSNSDAFQAVFEAIEKLEKQILKHRDRWRDTKRTGAAKAALLAEPAPAKKAPAKGKPAPAKAKAKAAPKPDGKAAAKRVYKVNSKNQRKPMTVEEAMLEFQDNTGNYMVYRDADSDRTHVLVKRDDGHFDLIES